jgi:hypothetical protein
LSAACLSTSACAVLESSSGNRLDIETLNALGAGVHYSEVLAQAGPPMLLSRLADGMVFRYEYTELVEHQYGLILPGKIGKWLKAVYADIDASVQSMTYRFDDAGLLLDATPKVWKADAGSGFSLTLIISAGSLTDTDVYVDSNRRINDWGSFLLQPIDVVLNAPQNLEMGTSGIELNGTNPAVGQHALELEHGVP